MWPRRHPQMPVRPTPAMAAVTGVANGAATAMNAVTGVVSVVADKAAMGPVPNRLRVKTQ